jgi:drug/metabolite transporter (DMT)-like permease
MLIGMALVTSYGAFSVYYAGLKRMDATHASVIATFEPLVAAVLAYSLFGEKFSLLGYAGSSLIIAAVLLVVLSGSRTRKLARTRA